MLKLNFYGAFGLATLSGCLWFLAVTPFDLSALAWVAAVPMLLAVDWAPTFKQALILVEIADASSGYQSFTRVSYKPPERG